MRGVARGAVPRGVMRFRGAVTALGALVLPATALAGGAAPAPVPVLGESGLLALGLALAVGGVLVIRRRRR